MPALPHLILHFDVNETIIVSDPAGGDTVDDCLHKAIAKTLLIRKSEDEKCVLKTGRDLDAIPSSLTVEDALDCLHADFEPVEGFRTYYKSSAKPNVR